MRTHLMFVLALAVLLLPGRPIIASEAEELREKAQGVKQEAVELKNQGRAEEAEKVAHKVTELLEAAERLEGKQAGVPEREIEKLHTHLKAMLDKERHLQESQAPEEHLGEIRGQIAKAKRELERLQGQRKKQVDRKEKPWPGPGPKSEAMAKLEETARRIEHLRIAAEHLHAAGAHDVADQLMEKAAAMEREAAEAKRRMAEERGPRPGFHGDPDVIGQLEELRREVGRLRDELNELRRHVREPGVR